MEDEGWRMKKSEVKTGEMEPYMPALEWRMSQKLEDCSGRCSWWIGKKRRRQSRKAKELDEASNGRDWNEQAKARKRSKQAREEGRFRPVTRRKGEGVSKRWRRSRRKDQIPVRIVSSSETQTQVLETW
jgi:hypothetical protein